MRRVACLRGLDRAESNPPHDVSRRNGVFPLFVCRDWTGLRADLGTLDGLVSLTLVTDPFSDIDIASLSDLFDVVRPFKQH